MIQQSSIFTKKSPSKPIVNSNINKVAMTLELANKLAQLVLKGKVHTLLEYQVYFSRSNYNYTSEVIQKAKSNESCIYTYEIDKENNKLVNRQLFINLDKIIYSHEKEKYKEIFVARSIPYTLSNLLVAVIIAELGRLRQISLFFLYDELDYLLEADSVVGNPYQEGQNLGPYYWIFSPIEGYKRLHLTTYLLMCKTWLEQERPELLTILD